MVGRAGRLPGYAGFEGCWLPGWRAVLFLPGLKADCVPVWRAVWFPSGLKADYSAGLDNCLVAAGAVSYTHLTLPTKRIV